MQVCQSSAILLRLAERRPVLWNRVFRRERLPALSSVRLRRVHPVVSRCGRHELWIYAGGLLSRDDRGFNVAVAIQHVTQHMLQSRERRLSGNVVRTLNLLFRNQGEGFADRFRRVMERGLK